MVHVLGVNASPRRNGNSDRLITEFLSGAEQEGAITQRIELIDRHFSDCTACDACIKNGVCILEDDMNIVYKAFDDADLVVLATPLYFSGMTGKMKTMIDRFQCYWRMNEQGISPLQGKKCYLIAVGAMKNANFRNVISEVRSFCIGVGMIYLGETLVPGAERCGEVSGRADVLASVLQAGRDAAVSASGTR